jgi:2-polyprenyl-3-methyl-5-hydroxy-6-metoxy-1,4-benzoquinol methylase
MVLRRGLCEGPAQEARKKLQQVIVGDVERIEINLPENFFDVLLLSKVLEHLVDPWIVLRRLYKLMKPGSIVISGSPNVCHYSVILALLRGRWRYEARGVFDATHLRWFCPAGYRELFQVCGFVVDEVGPAWTLNPKARIFNICTRRRLEYMLYNQIVLKARRLV